MPIRGADAVVEAEGNIVSSAIASCWRTPRGLRTRACVESPCARTGRSRARPSGRSPSGPLREGQGHTPEMNGHEKSDGLVVPAKLPNKTGVPVAEAVEGSSPAEGNTDSTTRPGRSAGQGVSSGLDRVREVAQKGQGRTVHRAAAPRRPRPPRGRPMRPSTRRPPREWTR